MNRIQRHRTIAELIGKSDPQAIPADGNADDLPKRVITQTGRRGIVTGFNELRRRAPGSHPFRGGISMIALHIPGKRIDTEN